MHTHAIAAVLWRTGRRPAWLSAAHPPGGRVANMWCSAAQRPAQRTCRRRHHTGDGTCKQWQPQTRSQVSCVTLGSSAAQGHEKPFSLLSAPEDINSSAAGALVCSHDAAQRAHFWLKPVAVEGPAGRGGPATHSPAQRPQREPASRTTCVKKGAGQLVRCHLHLQSACCRAHATDPLISPCSPCRPANASR